ncbi:MAG: toll/interleukin-1 receptor domain-containing protein, partial [Lachnospiraceae bacterium]|nr:toll/interleukin-1 receptor domain-containing protein [Lachnospiraceae bacterium]
MSTEAEGKEAVGSQPPGPSAPADERSYVAFISYRHKELDREAAIRIQKKIENYIVPKEYREKVGGKKLGIVFRDEDELPASSSLSDSITYALDHTQYLIVICTPDLPQSKWCLQEVSYFLKTHDRDHVLAVLVDGTPEESFPEQLRFTYDAEGRQLAEVEPLAANIAGGNHSINKKTFSKEVVRLFAAIIGCPFDALWQRERRARTNRLIAAMGVGLS